MNYTSGYPVPPISTLVLLNYMGSYSSSALMTKFNASQGIPATFLLTLCQYLLKLKQFRTRDNAWSLDTCHFNHSWSALEHKANNHLCSVERFQAGSEQYHPQPWNLKDNFKTHTLPKKHPATSVLSIILKRTLLKSIQIITMCQRYALLGYFCPVICVGKYWLKQPDVKCLLPSAWSRQRQILWILECKTF